MPVPAGKRVPSSVSSPSPDDGLEHELLRLLVEEEDRRRLGAEDRARDLDDRREERAERLLGADDAGGDRRTQVRLVGHVPPPTLFAVRYRTLFSWNGVSSGCFERIERADRRDVRRREAVPGDRERAAAEPRHLDVHAAAEELDRRARVVEEVERVGLLVAPDGDDGGEAPRVALDRHVVRRGDEDRALEVRAVGELVEHRSRTASSSSRGSC